jgi:murein DD-endopeptidase MepM/ murein hydrolase activator NlpD
MDPVNELSALKSSGAVGSLEAKKPEAPSPEQLRVLAAQFESMLMSQMLKQMQSAMFGDEDDDSMGFARGPLGDALYADLAGALSKAGGFGLADTLVNPLMRQTADIDSAVPADVSDLEPLSKSFSLEAGTTPAFNFASPAAFGPISSSFGWRQDPFTKASKFHEGTDIRMPIGQDVPVAQSGRVTFAGEQRGYGLTVMVEHGPGLSTRYAHLSEIEVAVGQNVALGQTIAKSGASGRATGPHLHFEVLEGGNPIDPAVGLSRLGTSVQKVE